MNNLQIKQQILEKLANDPTVDASKIGVIVDKGIVTLIGRVKSMEICARAESLAGEVSGVKAIAQEIQHSYQHSDQPADEEIVATILSEIFRNTMIPEDQLQVHVSDGCVIVTGDVFWSYQKNAVSAVLKDVPGIVDSVNQIHVVDPMNDEELESELITKLLKDEHVNSENINVSCKSGAVTLKGTIPLNADRSTILNTVNSVAGVLYISDNLTVLGV